jgi:hypothetical protein
LVDQDGIDAVRVSDDSSSQIFAKTEHDGDLVVGLFNTSAEPEVVSTTVKALGLRNNHTYEVDNLWTHHSVKSSNSAIAPEVPSYGVVLYRIGKLSTSPRS